MSVLIAILLGLLQGITIFLPISYSGHQAILQNWFGLSVPENDGLYDLLMSLSTLISILMVYRKDISSMLKNGGDFLRDKNQDDSITEGRLPPSLRLIYFIIIGTIPLFLSIPINNRAETLLGNLTFVGFAMIMTGLVLFASDKFIKVGTKNEKTMSTKDALFIGLAQALSAIPGLSRTGTTVPVGLTCGLSKEQAVRFSILLSLPSVLMGSLVSLFSMFRSHVDWPSFFAYLAGFIISIFAGYFSIQMLRLAAAKRKLRRFSYYIWAIGLITVILSLIH